MYKVFSNTASYFRSSHNNPNVKEITDLLPITNNVSLQEEIP
jgi:hypothetical protein